MLKTTRRIVEYAICPRCHGQGLSDQFECEVCYRAGKIVVKAEITEETTEP
jgi:DnaJ-class molecular chaperone